MTEDGGRAAHEETMVVAKFGAALGAFLRTLGAEVRLTQPASRIAEQPGLQPRLQSRSSSLSADIHTHHLVVPMGSIR